MAKRQLGGVRLALGLIACLAVATPCAAQQVAFTLGGGAGSGLIDLATGVTTTLTDDAAQVGSLLTADGVFAVRVVSPGTLQLRHMPSGSQSTIAADFEPRVAHPRQHVIFGQSAGQPARLDARGLARWDRCLVSSTGTLPMDLSIDGSTLFVLCGGDVIGVDTGTGQETRRLAAAGLAVGFAVNAAATEAVGWRNTGVPAELVRIDLTSGQVLATRPLADPFSYGVLIAATPRRDRIVANTCRVLTVNISCTPVLVDATTLADVRVLPSGSSFATGPTTTVSPDGRDAFVSGDALAFVDTFATWIDVESGAVRAQAFRSALDGGIGIAYRPRPLPPVLAPAQVAANMVGLAWRLEAASPMATRYVVEAGAAPGATMVTLGAAGTALGVPGAPPGRYYVRVRAVNRHGTSAPSNEIVVDVP